MLPATPALAQAGSCATAPQRVFNVSAIDVEITINRHGDNDPYGYMYVLDHNLTALRTEEAQQRTASATADDLANNVLWPERVANDPNARLVSNGLRKDLIQPLVLRARLGECVVINLTNRIERRPVSGSGTLAGNVPNLFQFPGGLPSVSVDMQGVSYDAAGGAGGQDAGNTAASPTAPGANEQYRFFLDPVMGEGTKVFRSGGESTALTAHGLFGALIAEPAGANWFDPETGQNRTGQLNNPGSQWSNWEAMITAPGQPTFREFGILYHEIGDENYPLRRPLRENFAAGATPVQDPFDPNRQIGGELPMVDRRQPDLNQAFFRGANTASYRPGGRAINYRAESFFRRLQHESLLVFENSGTVAQAAREQVDNKSLTYSSYTYGDPATPIPMSYLGEPTKTRLAHVGFEQLHVHHLHGGGDRWRQNPDADDTRIDSGLDKEPLQDAQSIRLDSQTISPEETFSLEHECGAGGCQQSAGDFLFHCHIAHHYFAGMWGIWRVLDTARDDLAPLPGDAKPAAGVTSAQLLGTTLAQPDGRTVVLRDNLTNPDTQVAIEDIADEFLPPQGARINKQDATTWDWINEGTATEPLYVGEEEDTRIWENFRSESPGDRLPILFNPANGRPAYPLLQPHLAQRPPFAPNEHSGAPWLGNTVNDRRPDGLCPAASDVIEYDITAVSIDDRPVSEGGHPDGGIRMTDREVDPGGMLFTLNEDKQDLLSGARPADPFVIRSNVGDCVEITFGNEISNTQRVTNGLKELAKTNMHTHFVQFDVQGSDGITVGFNYDTSIFPVERDGRELVSVDDSDTITVNQVDNLRTGIAIAVGLGTPNIEIRTITAIDETNNTLTFDRALDNSHAAGVPVTVEFTQHRWYSDVDSGTVFFHDHVDGIISWAHGLFAAHIIEPAGSTYHDPVTGDPVRSGPIVDIRNTSQNASVGVGQSGSFREFMIFTHNGRTANQGPSNFILGQECEEGSINLRAAPFGERTPIDVGDLDGDPANPVDVLPAGTDQRFEYNGSFADLPANNNTGCRNAFTRNGPSGTNVDTVAATVTTVDPYVFSSVKYGDPLTPLLRAYVGDDVVIRTLGLGERAEALRFQGHRFRMERFNEDGQLMDAAVTGISERFDYVLDGGAGGTGGVAGDFLYYSTRTFAMESGAWGIFRVHDTRQTGDDGLQPLPDNAPPTGAGFPIQEPHDAANPQANPGPNPAPPSAGNVSDNSDPCPRGQIPRIYTITAFDHPLPSAPNPDTEGVVYALTSDVAAIQSGQKEVEPLVLRVNQGDCVQIRLRNRIDSDFSPIGDQDGSRYGGTRAGLDLGMLARNQQTSGGSAVGLNPDTTVATGQDIEYRFFADQELGTTIFQNLGSPASLRHGGYGMLVVEPAGSAWFDSATGAPLGSTLTTTQAVIDPPGTQPAFREFALNLQTTDQHYSRSVIPYFDTIAGSGINPQHLTRGQATVRPAPIVGAPPGTRDDPGAFNKGFNHINYHSAPLTGRIGLTDGPGHLGDGQLGWFDPGFEVNNPYGNSLSSTVHDDPATPVLQAHSGDRVVIRLGVGASDQLHSFILSGHQYPLEPDMAGSQLMASRTITGGQAMDVWPVGGAGGPRGLVGDYAYRDSRQPWTAAGMWGLLRVLPDGTGGIIPLP
ncbi:MAG: hypothetical protein ACRDT2_08195 [Natronosporangium sp.]